MQTTVLFADISRSGELYRLAGHAAALKTIADCVERLCKTAESCGGHVVKTVGDMVMALFSSPDAAARAAAKMHAMIDALPAVAGRKLGVHIGFHTGPVERTKDEVVGDTVKLAARLLKEAQNGQTLTSDHTAALLSPRFGKLSSRSVALQENGENLTLCEIVAQAHEAEPLAAGAQVTWVQLSHASQFITCSRENQSVVIGRHSGCGVVVSDRLASRRHCTVDLRGDCFVLQDHSSNGTFVSIDGEKPVLLKGEALALRHRGTIGFSDRRFADSDVVEFFCF